MKKCSLKVVGIFAVILALFASLFGNILSSTAQAAADPVGELETFIYRKAFLESCVDDYVLSSNTAIGNSISSIVGEAIASGKVGYLATGLDGESMGCEELASHVFSGNITKAHVKSGGLLNGVYDYGTEGEHTLQCQYDIWNDDKDAVLKSGLKWPQGYYVSKDGDVDKTGTGAATIIYNDAGELVSYSGLEEESRRFIDEYYELDINYSDPASACTKIVKSVKVFVTAFAGPGDGAWRSVKIDSDVHIGGSDARSVKMDSLKAVTGESKGTTMLNKTANASSQLKSNLQKAWFGSASTTADSYLSSNAWLRYLYYGRYAFNADGGNSKGCGYNKSVAHSDPNYATLIDGEGDPEWGKNNNRVTDVYALAPSGYTSAKPYRVQTTDKGASFTFIGTCSDVLSQFSSAAQANFSGGKITKAQAGKTVFPWMGVINAPITPSGGSSGGSGSGGGGGSNGWSLDNCYSVAGVAGWIVCPAVDFMKTMMETAYTKLIEPMLKASPQLLGGDTQKAWGTFRDFANVIFALILLLVILSQVTGYGIDNYGIKRMLPKLIVGAILVNFSFFICQIALDISNIIGSGLQGMLSSIGGGDSASVGTHIASMIGGLLTFAVGGTLAVGAGLALTGSWAFLLPAVVALISGVISFLFLFVILGVRQAGIVILSVAAPVALVLYILPNTQSWAKRWAKMFAQLLLAYPIIGAVIGGCYAASNIIMGIDGTAFWTYLAGTLLAVVPYLMIPTILRSSMSALGSLGTALTGFGQRMSRGISGGAGNAIRQSAGFQAMQNRAAGVRTDRVRRAENRSAQKTIDKLNAIKARGGTLSERQERDLARAQRTATANIRSEAADARAAAEYERLSSPTGQASLQAGLAAEAENAAIKDETAVLNGDGYDYDGGHVDSNDMSSLEQALAYETSQDGEQNIARIMALKNTLESKYAKKGMDAVSRVIDSGNMKGEGARRVINSVASDGNYKNQSRSTFAAANEIKKDAAFQATGAVAGGQVSAIRNSGGQVNNMKTENIGQMTDDEFNAFVSQMVNPNADIRNSAGRMAQEALDDDTVRSQLNSTQISQLESLARNTDQVSSAAALQQEQDRVFNIQQQAVDQSHQQFAQTQGQDSNGFYTAPAGWRTIRVNGGGANNNRYARDPNNPGRIYDRKTNTFRNTKS